MFIDIHPIDVANGRNRAHLSLPTKRDNKERCCHNPERIIRRCISVTSTSFVVCTFRRHSINLITLVSRLNLSALFLVWERTVVDRFICTYTPVSVYIVTAVLGGGHHQQYSNNKPGSKDDPILLCDEETVEERQMTQRTDDRPNCKRREKHTNDNASLVCFVASKGHNCTRENLFISGREWNISLERNSPIDSLHCILSCLCLRSVVSSSDLLVRVCFSPPLVFRSSVFSLFVSQMIFRSFFRSAFSSLFPL